MFIAEVKVQSPYGFRSQYEFDALLERAVSIGDALSIHTDPRWGGSWKSLETVCNKVSIPVLAKGLHSEWKIHRAFECGATWALTVGWESDHPQAWYEPTHDRLLGNLSISSDTRKVIVVNSRDLQTGLINPDVMTKAKRLFPKASLVQASGIRSPENVDPECFGFIVGEALMEWPH